MDIEALHLIKNQKEALEVLPNISDQEETFESYERTVERTMTQTKTVIDKVSSYTKSIREELEDVRNIVKKCSIRIGDQIKVLMKNNLLKDSSVDSSNQGSLPATNVGDIDQRKLPDQKIKTLKEEKRTLGGRSNFKQTQVEQRLTKQQQLMIDQTKLQQVQTMQKLAEQQQRLMAFIAETENLALKVESDAVLTYSDIAGMKDHLDQWCNCLETSDENKRRIKKEKEKEERQQKEKEKEEKKKNEQAEKKKREEAERLKREKEQAVKRKEEEAERQRKQKEEDEKKKKEESERFQRQKEEDEKRKKEESERLQRQKEEDEQRKKAEAERQRKEKEEREAEEKRKREEEENKRRDWKNWPDFVYHNKKKNKFEQKICCVILAYPDGITRDDLECDSSDTDTDLDMCLESNDEQVISAIVAVNLKRNKSLEFKMPIRIYIPVVKHDEALETTLKFRISGTKKWYTGEPVPTVDKDELYGITFVGVEIPYKHFQHLQCVAVARHKCDETDVDENGKVFEPKGDRNTKVKFPPYTFPGKTMVTTKSVPFTNKDIKNATKKHKELMNIKTAGSFIDITCEESTKQDGDLEIHDFGWVGNKEIEKAKTVNQETLNRCSRWLVNNMNISDVDLQEVFDSDFVDEIQATESEGDKNRLVLSRLLKSNDCAFDKFVELLNSKQQSVADQINFVQAQVRLSRKSSSITEDDFSNKFDPDFTMKKGTLCVVSKLTGKSWEVVPLKACDEHPKARFVKLPAGNNTFQVLGLVVPNGMRDEDICRAAEILEGLTYVTNVSVICRQKRANPHDVIIECVRSENVRDTLQHLDSLGYNDGPVESTAFGVVDGEEIEIRIESNLYLEGYKLTPLKFKFYKNLPLDKYSGNIEIVNRSDQKEEEKYHGYLKFCVPPGRVSLQRRGRMVIYVPKPLELQVGNFPYTINVSVKALAKYIAWQLTKDKSVSKWVIFAGNLTKGNKRLYNDILKHIDRERIGAPQRERCEAFIVFWSDCQARFDGQVEKVIKALHDKRLEEETKTFIKPYLHGTGIFSNDSLEQIACLIVGVWELLAKKLGFSNENINEITNGQPNALRRALRMLDLWRLSDTAIENGTNLVKYFYDMAESAQCGAKLLSMISNAC